MDSPDVKGEKTLGNDNELPIRSIPYDTRISYCFRRIPIRSLSLLLFLWPGSLMTCHKLPPPITAMAEATPSISTLPNAGRRRCIGQFLADYNTNSGNSEKKKKNQSDSMLHWINENTSCDLPSEPSSPSWNWKKKDPNTEERGESKSKTFDGNKNDPFHVVMLLMENQEIYNEVVALSAGFLVAGLEVTVFYISLDDGTTETHERNQRIPDLIQSEIFQRIPSRDDIIQGAQDSFRILELNLNEYTSSSNELDACMYERAPSHPLNKCSIAMAPTALRMLLDEINIHIPPRTRDNDGTNRFDFVLMMDASFLGGLLFSEIKSIPSIVIGSHHTLMFAIEQEPDWSPSPHQKTLDRMDKIFLQRLYSLSLTGVFLKANKMRHSLGMKRVMSPLEHYLPVVAVLVDLLPSDIAWSLSSAKEISQNARSDGGSIEMYSDDEDGQGYGYRVHNLQPLLPPCTLCRDEESSPNIGTNSSVIMVAPPAGASAKWIRSLIRALSLTKQSLEGYDDCLFDRATCRNGVAGFEVNWLTKSWEEDDRFPPVVPSYIHREVSESLLDSAIRNPNTIIALIHCDFESSILASFGIEVFCISQSNRIPTIESVDDLLHKKGYISDSYDMDSSSKLLQESLSRKKNIPEEIATQLLTVLRRKSVVSEISSTEEKSDSIEKRSKEIANRVTSGLQKAVAIVQTTARLHREKRWKNTRQMQEETSSAITNTLHSMDLSLQGEDTQQSSKHRKDFAQDFDEMFNAFIAWIVFLAAAIFICLKDTIAMKRWRAHRHHQYYRSGGTIFDSFVNRLDDLEKAWDMLLSWSSELTAPKPDVDGHMDRVGRSRSNENTGNYGKKEHQLQNNNSNNHQHGQVRRRRKMKTTR